MSEKPKLEKTTDGKTMKEPVVKNSPTSSKCNNHGLLFWGLVLIALGSLSILNNLGWIAINWGTLYLMWPLILVWVGLSMLSSHGTPMRFLSITGQIIIAVLVILVLTGVVDLNQDESTHWVDETVQINNDSSSVKQIEVRVDASGELAVTPDEQEQVLSFSGNGVQLKREISGSTERFKISRRNLLAMNNPKTTVNFSKNWPLSLDVKFGAGQAQLDLRGLQLSRLYLDSGASNVDIFLDSQKQSVVDADFNFGASNVNLYLPKEAAVRLKASTGMTAIDVANLESKGDGIYESVGLNQSTSTRYNVNINSGVANFRLHFIE